jgi:hypothetical protein
MGFLAAVLLGVVQAITEFLPVSSTAHLLLVGELLGESLDDPRFRAFVTIIQSGTSLAVLVYFRQDLWRIGAAWMRAWPGTSRSAPFRPPLPASCSSGASSRSATSSSPSRWSSGDSSWPGRSTTPLIASR